jgi:hypothetical protein
MILTDQDFTHLKCILRDMSYPYPWADVDIRLLKETIIYLLFICQLYLWFFLKEPVKTYHISNL